MAQKKSESTKATEAPKSAAHAGAGKAAPKTTQAKKPGTEAPKAVQTPAKKATTVDANKVQRALFVTAEAMPYLRSGGLGDVAGALPIALAKEGIDCRVVMPMYSLIPSTYTDTMRFVGKTFVQLGWRSQYVGVFESKWQGITYYFVDNKHYFDRSTMYGQFDDAERFAFFSKAVLEVLTWLDFDPQVIHCNDWHTGLVPVFLDVFYRGVPKLQSVHTIFTIHNIQFQGEYELGLAGDICGLPWDRWSLVEYNGRLNMMKGAIECSNYVTTVSPTYAEEILDTFYSYGLEDILRARKFKIKGIINGIDTSLYNPMTDSAVSVPYSLETVENRVENKKALCEVLGLPYRADRPIISMVSRLTTQKGLDLVLQAAEQLLMGDLQLVILGTGEWRYETALKELEHRYKAKLRVIINFSKDIAGKLYCGSDIFLMPSRFEPCGLSQLIAMRYGAVPVVRLTGGLKDTVPAYNPNTQEGRGFTFYAYHSGEMLDAVWRAVNTYYNDKAGWSALVRNCMAGDFSWDQSAKQYAELYNNL